MMSPAPPAAPPAVRPYQSADRAALRRLACDTADVGRPFGFGFDAREFLADLLTRYHTDVAPDWTWVAAAGPELAGYVCAAPDSRGFRKAMARLVLPALLKRALTGVEFRRRPNLRFLGRQAWDWLLHGRATPVDETRYPAHLHLNLAPAFRGRGVGRVLLQTCLDALARAGVPGVRASVRDDNAAGQAFFKRMGFQPLGTGWAVSPAPGMRRRAILMGRYLALAAGLILSAARAQAAPANGFPALRLEDGDRILVLAPHPDDEALGCGGVIQEAASRALPLRVAFFTLGDNNELAFLLNKKRPVVFPSAVRAMGETRGREALAAAEILGAPPDRLTFLGYPDFGTLNMWYYHWRPEKPFLSMLTRADRVPYAAAFRPGAPYLGDSVLEDLTALLREFRPSRVFLPHPADTNPDHAALYLYTRVALWTLALEPSPELHPYLAHYPGWPAPRGWLPEADLFPPARLARQPGWVVFPLAAEARARKEKALRAHATQFAYSADYLRSFVRANELFGRLPDVRLRSSFAPALSGPAALLDAPAFLPGASLPAPAGAEDVAPAPDPGEQRLVEGLLEDGVGAELQSVALRDGNLVATLHFSRPLAGLVRAQVNLFGFRPDVPFGRMPKLRVNVSPVGSLVYDRYRRVPAPDVLVSRRATRLTVTVPLARLGRPDRLLVSMRTTLGGADLDWSCWRAVVLEP